MKHMVLVNTLVMEIVNNKKLKTMDSKLKEYDDIHIQILNFIENSKTPAENILEFFGTFSYKMNKGITRTFLMAIKPIKNKYNLENVFQSIKEVHDSISKNRDIA